MTAPAASPSLAAVLALVDEYHDATERARGTHRNADIVAEKTARAALVAELRRLCEDAQDAARWRAIRPMLDVDSDLLDGDQGPIVCWLTDHDKLSDLAREGLGWTVEGLVDAAIADRAAARLTPEPAHHDG